MRNIIVLLLAMLLWLPTAGWAKTLESIAISGKTQTVTGGKITLSCKARFSNRQTVTVKPTWSSSRPQVATVSPGGTLTGTGVGAATIKATYSYAGVTREATTVVTVSKKLVSLSISGADRVSCYGTTDMTATARFSDGTYATVTPTWSSSQKSYATVSGTGKVSGFRHGAVTISASYTLGGITKKASKHIDVYRVLSRISISGLTGVSYEKTIKLSCKAYFNDGSSSTVTPSWSLSGTVYMYGSWVSTTLAASITSGGTLKNKAPLSTDQTITVKASYAGCTATHTVILRKASTSGGSGGGGGTASTGAIHGNSTLKSGKSGTYYFYYGGKKITSGVTWKSGGLYLTVWGHGSYAHVSAGTPPGSTGRATLVAVYKGKSYRKSITVSRY